MDTEEEKEFIDRIKQAIARGRGYADHFGWPPNRDLEEWGVVDTFCEAQKAKNQLFLIRSSVKSRGRGNDPPDCEAQDFQGNRIGIEVTELVDPTAIEALKQKGVYEWAEWDREKIIRAITERLDAKDKVERIKGGPYATYVVIIHTDEPSLNVRDVSNLLKDTHFPKRKRIGRAFLLLSYDPEVKTYPCLELDLGT